MAEAFEIHTSDGVCLRGEIQGSGPSLIFSNSLGVTREMWQDQVTSLSAEYTIILYDTRGHGASDAPRGNYSIDRLTLDVLDLMDGLNVDRAHFCGLSLGGMTGQAFALRTPARLLSLTLAATSSYMGPPEAWQNRIETVLGNGMETIADAVLERWFADEGEASDEIINVAKDWLLETDPVGYAGCCAAIRDMDLRPLVTGISTPTLILTGKNDTATPIDHASFLNDQIPDSSLTSMHGGHLLNLEQPDLFTDALHQFLRNMGN